MKKVAMIPLKSDSVRFPDKNFKCINGKPLLINTMDKLNEAGIDIIVISTDSVQRVHSILKSENTDHHTFDALYVIDRPNNLMGDAETELVVADVIKKIPIDDNDYTIVLTQVTSPLWNPARLKLALDKLSSTNAHSVVSVSPNYDPNGCFYVFDKSTFLQNNKIYTDNLCLVTMSCEESIDIDFEYGLFISNALMRGNYV